MMLPAFLAIVLTLTVSAATSQGGATADDSARFLAGMMPSPSSPLLPLTREQSWVRHGVFFDRAWVRLEAQQLSKVRTWSAGYLRDPSPTAYYMFSGPDFVYLNAFFPAASTYILCGKEAVGRVPDLTRLSPAGLEASLANLEASLNSVLSFSFFITKELRSEPVGTELQGTLPFLYAFLARSGKTVQEVSFIDLDASGAELPTGTAPAKGLTHGVKIDFTAGAGARQTLYYFDTDISDDGIKRTPGFINFCQSRAPGDGFLKAASYLPHERGFEKINEFLLRNSRTLVQDDSGIPIRWFDPKGWQIRLFGRYSGPIEIFKQWNQPQLAALYSRSNPIPLDFGLGYRHLPGDSALILAVHR